MKSNGDLSSLHPFTTTTFTIMPGYYYGAFPISHAKARATRQECSLLYPAEVPVSEDDMDAFGAACCAGYDPYTATWCSVEKTEKKGKTTKTVTKVCLHVRV